MFFNTRVLSLFALVAVAVAQGAPAPSSPAPASEPASSSPAPAAEPASSAPAPPASESDPAPAPSSDAPASSGPVAQPQQAAAAPNQKIVRSINCTDFTKKGSLQVSPKDGKPSAVQFSDDKELVTGSNAVDVIFTECKSSAMDVESSGSTHYGLLSPADAAQKTCVRVNALAQANQHLKTDDCSKSDDSSQMAQFWQFDEDKKSLTLVGRIGGKNPYSLDVQDNFITASPNGTDGTVLNIQ